MAEIFRCWYINKIFHFHSAFIDHVAIFVVLSNFFFAFHISASYRVFLNYNIIDVSCYAIAHPEIQFRDSCTPKSFCSYLLIPCQITTEKSLPWAISQHIQQKGHLSIYLIMLRQYALRNIIEST